MPDHIDIIIKARERISLLCQKGFPFVDSAFFENPTVLEAGLLLRRMIPGVEPDEISQLLLHPKRIHQLKLSDLVNDLKNAHETRFWYRGQAAIRRTLYFGHVDRLARLEPRIGSFGAAFECLIPSAFRTFTKSKPASWKAYRNQPALEVFSGLIGCVIRSDNSELKDRLVDFLFASQLMLIQLIQPSWHFELERNPHVEGTTLFQECLDLVSLSQHYGFGSVMVDITRDIDTAVWFATRDWETGHLVRHPGEQGVIYRFDESKIRFLVKTVFQHSTSDVRNFGAFGIADISSRFAGIADRPRAQQGGSLLGMENLIVNFLLCEYGAIEIFSFDHDHVSGEETAKILEDICPPGDPGETLFVSGKSHPITAQEFRRFLEERAVPTADINRILESFNAGVL